MVGGFNTNIRYRGRIFHVQTEDGGEESPHIITLLYEGGAILFSKKSSYEDQLEKDGLEEAVRELMEAQHRVMVSALKAGKLDDKVGIEEASAAASSGAETFGADVITSARLDELVLAHLQAGT